MNVVSKYNILIVDDNPDILELISIYLNDSIYNVTTASCSENAISEIKKENFHLIILDIMLPDFDGTTLCKQIREYFYNPILFISCIDDEEYIVDALKIGVDDYILKPFNPKELVARIECNLRRFEYFKESQNKDRTITINNLCIDIDNSLVLKNDTEVPLSPIELKILVFMINNANRTLSCIEIYEHVWNNVCTLDTRTVIVHVSNLRKKLENNSTDKYIKTITNKGYRFVTYK